MHKLHFSGRVTKDAEMRYTQAGKAVTSFTVAVDDGYGDKKSTIWIKCTLWEKRAEALTQYLTKGLPVSVEGRLNHEDGNPKMWGEPQRASFEVSVVDIKLMGGKKQEEDYF